MSRERSPRRSLWVRLYGALIALLPPPVRNADGGEMRALFADLCAEADTGVGRAALFVRSAFRLVVAAAAEWGALAYALAIPRGGISELGVQVRAAVRSLSRSRLFTLSAVGLIGLGIGAVTVAFSVVDHVLLRPLPYPDPDRLVFVGDGPERRGRESHSGPVIRAMTQVAGVEGLAVAGSSGANLTGGDVPTRVTRTEVSEDFFRVFGARPERGRLLAREDFEAVDRAVLSYDTWLSRFGADPDVVGSVVALDGRQVTVVGVLDPAFSAPRALASPETDLWVPIDWSLPVHDRVDTENLEVGLRMAPGWTIESLQAGFDRMMVPFAEAYPDRFTDRGRPDRLPLLELRDVTVFAVRSGIQLLFGAVLLLLMVAAFNVAHLFLARGVGRLREMWVRRAIGAGTSALVRQLLFESLFVGLLGGVLGVAVGHLGVALLARSTPVDFPMTGALEVDGRIVVFAFLASLTTAVAFGLLPALRVAGAVAGPTAISARGVTSDRRSNRLTRGLVIAEVAMSLILVTQAGLLLRSLARVQAHDEGVDVRNVYAVRLFQPGAESIEEFVGQMEEVRRAVAALPQVEQAGFGLNLPFQITGTRRGGWSNDFEMIAAGRRHDEISLRQKPVSAGYFEALGIPLVAGSLWAEAGLEIRSGDAAEGGGTGPEPALPVVLSRSAAEYFFGAATSAVGETLTDAERPGRVWQVVGVAEGVRHWGLDQPEPDAVYLPTWTMPRGFRSINLAIKFRGEPDASVLAGVRGAVWGVAPDLPVPEMRALEDMVSASTAVRRFDSILFGTIGALGLLLASAGLCGTLLFAVRRRWRELGIRLALGATAARVARRVMGDGVRMAALGVALGVVGAWWSGRWIEGRLYGVDGHDPATLLASAAVLLSVTALASWLPAWAAGRSSPLEALTSDDA